MPFTKYVKIYVIWMFLVLSFIRHNFFLYLENITSVKMSTKKSFYSISAIFAPVECKNCLILGIWFFLGKSVYRLYLMYLLYILGEKWILSFAVFWVFFGHIPKVLVFLYFLAKTNNPNFSNFCCTYGILVYVMW